MSYSPDTKTPQKAFDAFAVKNDKDGKGHFHKVGAAFAHKDGKGYDIDLAAMPTNGRVTLRSPQERLEAKRAEAVHDTSEHWANRGQGGKNAAPKDKGRE